MNGLCSDVFNFLPDPVIVVGEDGLVRAANTRAAEFFRCARDEIVGAPVRQLIPDAPDGDTPVSAETEAVRQSGERVPVELHVGSLPGDGSTIISVLDIAQRKRLEEDLQLDRVAANVARMAKSEFFIRITHALKTPLHAIIGFSDVLAGQITDEKQQRFIGHVRENGQRLLRLIEDLLDLARAESGHTPAAAGPVELAELIDRMVLLVSDFANRRRITLSVDVEQSLPRIIADEARLKSAIYNLLDNMVASACDGGRVTVRGGRDGDSGVHVIVEDCARVEAEPQRHASDEPSQAGELACSSGESGIGMALVRRFVATHGGHLQIHTNGRGSLVRSTIFLPAVDPIGMHARRKPI